MSSFLVALIVPIVLAVLGAMSRSQARRVGDQYVVEYSGGLKGLAWLFGVVASGIAIGSLFLEGVDRLYLLATSAIFVLPAALLFPIAYGTWIAFDGQGMHIKRPLRQAVFVRWSEIVNVKGSSRGSYTVVLKEGAQVEVHTYMSGAPALLREMQRQGVRGALLAEALES